MIGALPQGNSYRMFLEEAMLVHVKRGLVRSFFVSKNEPAAVTNIKKYFLTQLQRDVSHSLELMKKQPVSSPLSIPSKIKEEKSLVYTYPGQAALNHQSSSNVVQAKDQERKIVKTQGNIS